jgi:hypothetical protein
VFCIWDRRTSAEKVSVDGVGCYQLLNRFASLLGSPELA